MNFSIFWMFVYKSIVKHNGLTITENIFLVLGVKHVENAKFIQLDKAFIAFFLVQIARSNLNVEHKCILNE